MMLESVVEKNIRRKSSGVGMSGLAGFVNVFIFFLLSPHSQKILPLLAVISMNTLRHTPVVVKAGVP